VRACCHWSEREREVRMHAILSPSLFLSFSLCHSLFPSVCLSVCLCLSLSLPPSLFLTLSLTGEQGAHTLFTDQREREREREREIESEKEGGRERIVILIFKRNDGALAPFGYLVFNRIFKA
jgi:hypothetical protein